MKALTRKPAMPLVALFLGFLCVQSAMAATLTASNGLAIPGGNTSLSLSLGSVAAETGFEVELAFPAAQLEVVAAGVNGGFCSANNATGVIVVSAASLSPLAGGSRCSLEFTVDAGVAIPAPGNSDLVFVLDVRNAVFSDSNGNELVGPHTLIDGEVRVPAGGLADLQLNASASAAQVAVNAPVTLTATSVNQGPSAAQNVNVSISLGPPLRYSSHAAAGASCSTPAVGASGTVNCTWAGATAMSASRVLSVVGSGNVTGSATIQLNTTSASTDLVPANNAAQLTVQVTGGAPPSILGFTASVANVAAGLPISMSWSSANATSCSPALGGATVWSSLGVLPTSNNMFAVTMPQTPGVVTFRIYCTNGSESVSATTSVNVTPGTTPLINWFYPGLATAVVGTPITLYWSSSNSTSCSPSQGAGTVWSSLGTLPAGGLRSFPAPQATGFITFELSCTNGAQTVVKTAQINVNANATPTASLTVQMTAPSCDGALRPHQVPISWSSTNAAFCLASEVPITPPPTTGTRTTWSQLACVDQCLNPPACTNPPPCPDQIVRRKLRPSQTGEQLFILNDNAGTQTTLHLECFASDGGASASSPPVTLTLVTGTISDCPLIASYTPDTTATTPAPMPDGSYLVQAGVSNPQSVPLSASVLQQGQYGDVTVEMIGDTVTVRYYPRTGDFPEATVVTESVQVLVGNGSNGVPVTYIFQVDLALFSNGFE